MRHSSFVVLSPLFQILIAVFLVLSYSDAASKPDLTNFLGCLPNHSEPSVPITKSVYTPKSPSFSSVLQAYIRNLRFNTSTTPKPLAIVTAKHWTHVQSTVICAEAHGLEIRIRSGGHDYEGLSYVSFNPFVILDLFNLRSINIDLKSNTAWVESGATLGELYYNIAKKSNTLAFPGGVCPTVGAGGHFTGGGYGNLLRKFGLTVDNIVDAVIVDVNGRILDRKAMGEDLFWAIRGGGAASFCVVLSWKLSLVPIPPILTTFVVRRTLEEGATNIVHQWQHFAPFTDPNLFVRAQSNVIQVGKGPNKTVQVSFIALYLGRAKELLTLVNKDFPLLGLKQKDCLEGDWIKSIFVFDELPLNTSHEFLLSRVPYFAPSLDKHKSDYVKSPIPKVGLEALWKKLIQLQNVSMQFNPYGGKMYEIPENATPFPHRKGNLFKIQYLTSWNDYSPTVIAKNLQGMRDLYSLMAPFVSKNPREAFQNYRDIDIGTNANGNLTFALDFFKGNVQRLLMVKAKVDPTNFFTNEQSIPTKAKSY